MREFNVENFIGFSDQDLTDYIPWLKKQIQEAPHGTQAETYLRELEAARAELESRNVLDDWGLPIG